mgnify:FL=1
MITYILIIIFIISGVFLLYYGYKKILTAPLLQHADNRLNRHLSVKELGLIEGRIADLNEVIVIADRIEEPIHELYSSVKENLKKGVKYIFLISEHKYENEKNSYWKIFQAIGEAVKHNYKIENHIEIYSLNFDWEDYPYVFYRYKDADTNKQKAFAYMGTQLREGIADEYELINPTIARKMLELAFKGVTIPTYEKITAEELYNSEPKIIQFSKTA